MLSWALATSHRRIAVAQVNKMKLVLALIPSARPRSGASASPPPGAVAMRKPRGQVAQGGQTVTNIQVPKIFTTAFGSRCVKVHELTQ